MENSLASQQIDKNCPEVTDTESSRQSSRMEQSSGKDLLFMGFAVSEFYYLVTQQ